VLLSRFLLLLLLLLLFLLLLFFFFSRLSGSHTLSSNSLM
jgi:hypothetical protein